MMNTISCLLIDDDVDEHEIFMISVEKNFDCSSSWGAFSIPQAIAKFETGEVPAPDYIFLDWGVIRHDPAGNLALLKTTFPHLSHRICVMSGVLPLVDPSQFGIARFYKKQNSIEAYAHMLKQIIDTENTLADVI